MRIVADLAERTGPSPWLETIAELAMALFCGGMLRARAHLYRMPRGIDRDICRRLLRR